MLVGGLSCMCPMNAVESVKWKCPPGAGGTVLSISVNDLCAQSFVMLEFNQIRNDEVIERLIQCKELAPIVFGAGATAFSVPSWEGGVLAACFQDLCASGAPWWIEENDVLLVRVANRTAANQIFDMGFKIGDEGVATDARWWADETGKPVRPLTFLERGLKMGTRVGSLTVVDGSAYGKFDR